MQPTVLTKCSSNAFGIRHRARIDGTITPHGSIRSKERRCSPRNFAAGLSTWLVAVMLSICFQIMSGYHMPTHFEVLHCKDAELFPTTSPFVARQTSPAPSLLLFVHFATARNRTNDTLSETWEPSVSDTQTTTMTPSSSVTPTRSRGSHTLSLTQTPSRSRGTLSYSNSPPSVSYTASQTNSSLIADDRSASSTVFHSSTDTFVFVTHQPNATATLWPTNSNTSTMTLSNSAPTLALTSTNSSTRTVALVPTATELLTDTPTHTNSFTDSYPSRTLPQSESLVHTETKTMVASPTLTESVTPPAIITMTVSNSLLPTMSRTALQSATPTLSSTIFPTMTHSQFQTATQTYSNTLLQTLTVQPTVTLTPVATATETYTESLSGSFTPSLSSTLTSTISTSASSTLSSSGSLSLTETYSLTATQSLTPIATDTLTAEASATDSDTRSISRSLSVTTTASLSSTASITGGSPTTSFSFPQTESIPPTSTQETTGSVTDTVSRSGSASLSSTPSLTTTTTQSLSASLSLTHTQSRSDTSTLSLTLSPSRTETLSQTGTHSITLTYSMSTTASCSVSNSLSQNTFTMSLSLPPTTSVIPPTTTLPSTPTRTLPTSCPDDCMNGQCTRDPRWAFVHFCACYQTAARGYWAGSEQGGPCDKCSPGYFGTRCTEVCPGGACSLCGGHGTCRDGRAGDGTCDCYADWRGHWAGVSCLQCVNGWYGPECKSQCTCTRYGTCNDGRLGNGGCTCITEGWSGESCEVCDPAVVTNCEQSCQLDSLGRECSGNGTCTQAVFSVVCECFSSYAGDACQLQCPGSNTAVTPTTVCSGNGICNQGVKGTGACTCTGNFALPDCANCMTGYYGTDCNSICPGGLANPCNSTGVCRRDGVCECYGLYAGKQCNIRCPMGANNAVCSGHGYCTGDDAHCVCYQNSTHGYWQGANCDTCKDTHGGPQCLTACPVVAANNNAVCNGPDKGICNKTTGRCSCLGIWCGAYCDSTPDNQCSSCSELDLYGPDCTSRCDCVHGECDAGRSGTGACACESGYSGRRCDTACDGGAVNPCSGNGRCLSDTGHCECYSGFAGNVCDIQCPGGGTCSGNGVCDSGRLATGQCTCSANFVWPQTGCDTACNCNGHGRCDYPLAVCTCDARYDGLNCERCVSGFFNASTCAMPCYNGTTVGYDCVCDHGYGGHSCNILCPANAVGVCNNNGTCSRSTGLCECDLGWEGPICTCNSTTCTAKNKNTLCDPISAQCVCATRRTGADCSECLLGYYGSTCSTACDCNSNGPCNIETGLCICYADPVKGYWTGGTCNMCLDGYMGAKCQQKSSAVSTLSTLRYASTNEVTQLYAFFDEPRGIIYAGGNPLNAAFNVSSVLPTLINGGAVHNDTSNAIICGDIAGASMIENIPNVGQQMFFVVQPNVSSSSRTGCKSIVSSYTAPIGSGAFSNLTLFQRNAFYNAFSIDTVDRAMAFYLHDRTTNTICSIIDGTNQQLHCFILQTGNPLQQTFSVAQLPTRTIRAAILSKTYRNRIYIAGTDRGNLCAIVVAYTNEAPPTTQPISIAAYRLKFNNMSCTTVDSIHEYGDIVMFTIVQESMYLSAYNTRRNTWYTPAYMGAASQRTNGLVYDPVSKIGMVVFRTRVMKFSIDEIAETITAYGQSYITSAAVSQLIPHPSIQVVYAPLSTARGVEILRFMLLEVLSINPSSAERIGGTIITVTGRGFRNVTQLQCRVGDVLMKANYLSPTTLTCVAPPVLTTKACVTDDVEVSTTSIVYTQNNVGLDRPVSPTLESAEPSYARVNEPRNITLRGRGLINSPYSMCRFSDTGRDSVYTKATFLAATGQYVCMSPNATTPWSPSAQIHLSLDGQVYGIHPLPFIIIGSAVGIVVVPNALTAESSELTSVTPAITVYVVDQHGNRLGEVDNVTRKITIVTALTAINTEGYAVGGICEMTDYKLVLASSGSWSAQAVTGDWSASFSITVRYGAMVRLKVRTQPLQLGDIITPGYAIPRQTEIEGVDAAGNLVLNSIGKIISVKITPVDEATGALLLDGNETERGPIAFANNGIATFPQLVTTFQFGLLYTIFFALSDDSNINVTSITFYPQCPPQMFFVKGGHECIACPIGRAVCNGSDYLVANPGYWRATPYSLQFYECPRKEVCVGGVSGGCAEGYTGTLCAVCADGYGLGYRSTCDACSSLGVNVAIVIALLLALYILLVFGVLMVIQNYSVPEAPIGRLITTGLIFLCYLQTVTLLGLLDINATELFNASLSLIAVIADFRFYGIHTTACILTSLGLNLQHMSLTYLIGFLFMTLAVTFTVKLIVHFFPTVMMCQAAKDARAARRELVEAFVSLRGISTLNSSAAAAAERQAELDELHRRRFGGKKKKKRIVSMASGAIILQEHTISALLVATTQICILFLQQSVALTTFRLFDCIDIESDTTTTPYLRNDLRVACDSQAYISYHAFAVFVVLFLSIGLPTAFVLGIALARRHLSTEQYRLWTCTLTYGLKENFFYYQGILMARRIISICAIVFADYPIDAYSVMWVLNGFVAAQAFLKPFTLPEHNRYESFATASVIACGNIALLFRVTSSEQARLLLTALLLIIISCTIAYLLYALMWDMLVFAYHSFNEETLELYEFNTGTEVIPDKRGVELLEKSLENVRERAAIASSSAAATKTKSSASTPNPAGNDGAGEKQPIFSTGTTFDRLSSRFARSQLLNKIKPSSYARAAAAGSVSAAANGPALQSPTLRTDANTDDHEMSLRDGNTTIGDADTWYQRSTSPREKDGGANGKGGRGKKGGKGSGPRDRITIKNKEVITFTDQDRRDLAHVNATGGEDTTYHDQQEVYILTDPNGPRPPIMLAEEEMMSMTIPSPATDMNDPRSPTKGSPSRKRDGDTSTNAFENEKGNARKDRDKEKERVRGGRGRDDERRRRDGSPGDRDGSRHHRDGSAGGERRDDRDRRDRDRGRGDDRHYSRSSPPTSPRKDGDHHQRPLPTNSTLSSTPITTGSGSAASAIPPNASAPLPSKPPPALGALIVGKKVQANQRAEMLAHFAKRQKAKQAEDRSVFAAAGAADDDGDLDLMLDRRLAANGRYDDDDAGKISGDEGEGEEEAYNDQYYYSRDDPTPPTTGSNRGRKTHHDDNDDFEQEQLEVDDVDVHYPTSPPTAAKRVPSSASGARNRAPPPPSARSSQPQPASRSSYHNNQQRKGGGSSKGFEL